MDTSHDGRGGGLLTREAVRQRLEDQGKTITDWALENGFTREQVYAFLAGRTKGKRGVAHRVAVAFRVKAVPDQTNELLSGPSAEQFGSGGKER